MDRFEADMKSLASSERRHSGPPGICYIPGDPVEILAKPFREDPIGALIRTAEAIKQLKESLPAEGDQVEIACYEEGCEQVMIPVTLGREYLVTSDFARQGKVGRIRWSKEAKLQSFDIKRDERLTSCICPTCRKYFGDVIAITEPGKKAFFIGYESDPDRWGEIPAFPRKGL